MIYKSLLVTAISSLFSVLGYASDLSAFHEYRLDNGMKIVVKEDHRAPVVISQLWYKIGSADENSGTTGRSHVLEHMMFKGTKRYPAGRFSAIIAENGGQDNAFTSRDYTAYYQLLEKSRLPISFELESDRMRNLVLSEEDFRKELEVVKEERRLRTEDNPNALAYEQLYATAFNNNPYRNPVIGWMQDLNSMQLEDLRNWYANWYTPNNATLIVVGDVEPNAVYHLAKQYFGNLPRNALPNRKPRREPEQRGVRRVVVSVPAELPYLVMGYKVPALGDGVPEWEAYALEVLAAVLDGGRSARLTRHLVREQEVAASAGAGYDIYSRHDGLFLLDATPAPGHTVRQVEHSLMEQITRLKKTLVSNDELNRIKAQVLANKIYHKDSVSRQAILIGQAETIGLGWRVTEAYAQKIQAVNPEQIRKVAQRYLQDRTKTVVEVDPQPLAVANTTSAAAEALARP